MPIALELFLAASAVTIRDLEEPVFGAHLLGRPFGQRSMVDGQQSVELALGQEVALELVYPGFAELIERQVDELQHRLCDEQ